MTQAKAWKLVKECVDRELHSLAVDANMHDKLKAGHAYPYAAVASERRKAIRTAWQIVSGQAGLGL
jgi:hypothetical protein